MANYFEEFDIVNNSGYIIGIPAQPVYFKQSAIKNSPVLLMPYDVMREFFNENDRSSIIGQGAFGIVYEGINIYFIIILFYTFFQT